MPPTNLPAISGKRLIRLFECDGSWRRVRRAPHGVVFDRYDADGTYRYTTIPDKSRSLAPGTLSGILRQSGLGRAGLRRMIEQHG